MHGAEPYQLNPIFGLWWVDPVAALIKAPVIAKEGMEGLPESRGKP
jgi:hypothetical protein